MRILNAADVCAALPMEEAIAAVRWAYIACASGQALLPPRTQLVPPVGESAYLVMPAFVDASPDGRFSASLSVKTVSVYLGTAARDVPGIQGGVLVLDPQSGRCVALLEGTALTAIRTGAGSGVAADLLARPEASTLALLGAGTVNAANLEAICAVRSIQTVWIHNRTRRRAEALRATWAGRGPVPDDIRIVETAREAVQEADIICTATNAQQPLFEDSDLKPGAHINAVGAFRHEMQEIPPATVCRARLFVDHLESALKEAGDILQPLEAGLFTVEHIAGEIGAALAGSVPGRQHPEQITLFKSVGLAVQDAVAATVAATRAQSLGIGQQIDW